MLAFPLVERLFASNPIGRDRVAAEDVDCLAFREAEILLRQQDYMPIIGHEKLARDGSANVAKFVDILAELRFALLFASLGARVRLLEDDAFKPARYTPDLLVEFEGVTMLVDAIRGSSGSPPFAEALRKRLHDKGLPLSVEHFLGYRLSVSASDHREHAAGRNLCDRVADWICDELSQAFRNGEGSGVFRLFSSDLGVRIDRGGELYEDGALEPGEEWLGSFRFGSSWTGRGSAGGGATVARVINEYKHAQRFLEKLRTKAKKRLNLPLEHLGIPFVVAVQNHESELTPVAESPRVSQRLRKLGEWERWQGRASSHLRFKSELLG